MNINTFKRVQKEYLAIIPSYIIIGISEPCIVFIDSYFAGKIDSISVGAIGIGGSVLLLIHWLINALQGGLTSIIANLYAEKHFKSIYKVILKSIYISLVAGLLFTLIIYLFGDKIIQMYHPPKELTHPGYSYVMISSFGIIPLALNNVVITYYRAVKKTEIAIYLLFTNLLLNTFFNYLWIIKQWNPFPDLSQVEYIALASITSHFVVFAIILCSKTIKKTIQNRNQKSEKTISFKMIFGRANDMFLRTCAIHLFLFYMLQKANEIDTDNAVAHVLLMDIWMFSSYFIDSASYAIIILVAEKRQKNNKTELIQTIYIGISYCIIIAFSLSICYFFILNEPKLIWSNLNSKIKAITSNMTFIFIIVLISSALSFAADGILLAYEKTKLMRNSIILGTLCTVIAFNIEDMYNSLIMLWIIFLFWVSFRYIYPIISYKISKTTFNQK